MSLGKLLSRKMRWIVLPCLLAASLNPSPVDAAGETRPRIGLVLGGGGARGAAHIGVLEVLEKLRIPVDCVVGTSIGALISGAYAAGLSPSEMRSEMAKADWNDMFQDNPPYSEINYRNKAVSRRFLPGSETGVSGSGVAYQGGVVSGQKIKLFFNRLVHSDLGERDIKSLPLPLSIIATDIGTGDKVVFREGSLTSAMRASMSVPGLMAPVEHQGRKLVDGGLVDNVPIAEARERCQAEVIIAVNVGSPLMKAEDVGSLLSVSVQMVNILTEQNVSRSLATLGPRDIYIKPDLEGISAGDFQKSSPAADRGNAAAQAVASRLREFSVSEANYAAWAATIAYSRQAPPTIHEVQIAGLKIVNPAAVERHLRVGNGDAADDLRINQDMLRTYGDGWYESVDYSLLTARDRNILQVTPLEKRWGPDYLRLGVNLDTNFKQDSSYTLRAAYDKTWLNSLGGQLLLVGEIGRSNGLGIDLYQPVEARQRYFVESALAYTKESQGLYQNDQKLADYATDKAVASLGVGVNVGLLGQMRTGWRQSWLESTLKTGVATSFFPQQTNVSFGGQYLSLDFDQSDRLFFSTAGWASKMAYFNSTGKDYSKLAVDLRAAHSVGDYVFNAKFTYQGSPRGVLPTYDSGTLGGFLNLSGFAQGQLNGDNIRYGNIRAEKIIGRLPLGLRGDMRAGLALEAGKVGTPYTETQRTGWLNSTTVYLGGETPIGPVYLGYGRSPSNSSSVYLFLGTP
jgi:NTE family protein